MAPGGHIEASATSICKYKLN